MKIAFQKYPALALLLLVFILQGCLKDKVTTTYTSFEPVYKSKSLVLQNIKSSQPQPLVQTGKLVLYGQYIFVNELNKGVHIIDNSNPAAPRNIAFVNIPGNIDLALKNNILYADIYTDMVAIDISNPQNAVLKKLTAGIFPERDYEGTFAQDSSKYIVDWIRHEAQTETEISRNKSLVSSGQWLDFANSPAASGNNAAASVTGIGGSMARFTIVNNYLYTVGRSSLTAFNIIDPAYPSVENTTSLGWNIETIYPLHDKLFIGSQTGMFIYSISNPVAPEFVGSFSHACFDDPVIANDQYAFVTLRSMSNASPCWGSAPQSNELDIVDVSNIPGTTLLKVYDMVEPKGLSLDGNHLFLCDGKAGLKIFDVSNVMNIVLLKTFTDINPFDVIAYNGLAIVVSGEGISQYNYSDINHVTKLSTIAINK